MSGFGAQLPEVAEQVAEDGAEAAPADSTADDIDLALIEFLGKWDTDDGEWIAPSDFADEVFVELIETAVPVEIEEID